MTVEKLEEAKNLQRSMIICKKDISDMENRQTIDIGEYDPLYDEIRLFIIQKKRDYLTQLENTFNQL